MSHRIHISFHYYKITGFCQIKLKLVLKELEITTDLGVMFHIKSRNNKILLSQRYSAQKAMKISLPQCITVFTQK
jgi:hypothetical protein